MNEHHVAAMSISFSPSFSPPLRCAFPMLYGFTDQTDRPPILGLRTNYSIKLEKQTDLNLFEQAHLRLMHIFWTQNIKFEDMRTNKKLFLSLKDNSSLLFRYVEQSQKKERIVYKNLKRLTGPSNINHELNYNYCKKLVKKKISQFGFLFFSNFLTLRLVLNAILKT